MDPFRFRICGAHHRERGHEGSLRFRFGGSPACRNVFVLDDGAIASLKTLATDDSRDEVRRRIAAISHDDLATLVYTSGTTGMPKGCELTHYNFAWEVEQLYGSLAVLMEPHNRTLMFLPLAHIFARAVQSASVSSGATIGFSTGIPQLLEELSMYKPTWIFSVPRVFEKIYNGAKQKAEADGRGKIFDKAAATAIAYSQGIERGRSVWGPRPRIWSSTNSSTANCEKRLAVR